MPLSPEKRTQLIAKYGADASASDEVLLLAADEENEALKADMEKVVPALKKAADALPGVQDQVLSLSAERDELKSQLEAKQQEVLSLSADAPRKPDPVVASMYADNLDQAFENAVAAGMSSQATEYFAGLFKDASGSPTPLMLSGDCQIQMNGKTKRTTLAMAVAHGLQMLAKGGFGQGVATGIQTQPLLLSGDTTAGEKKPMTEAEYKNAMSIHGHTATHDDYVQYLQNR